MKKKDRAKQLIRGLEGVYCRIGRSEIDKDGVGVVAIRDIPKGVNPFSDTKSTKWDPVPMDSLKGISPEVRKMINDFGIQTGNERTGYFMWMPRAGFNNLTICYFLNHSKRPNMATNNHGDSFYTLRKIKKGEELSVDYETYDEEGHAFLFE